MDVIRLGRSIIAAVTIIIGASTAWLVPICSSNRACWSSSRDCCSSSRAAASAIDSDIIKAYVAEGVGIAVIPTLALDLEADRALRVVDVTHLFPKSAMTVSLRRDIYLRRFVPDFIQLVAPRWSYEAIQKEMTSKH